MILVDADAFGHLAIVLKPQQMMRTDVFGQIRPFDLILIEPEIRCECLARHHIHDRRLLAATLACRLGHARKIESDHTRIRNIEPCRIGQDYILLDRGRDLTLKRPDHRFLRRLHAHLDERLAHGFGV